MDGLLSDELVSEVLCEMKRNAKRASFSLSKVAIPVQFTRTIARVFMSALCASARQVWVSYAV